MSKHNGTQVAVEFEDWSERPQPNREDLRKEVERLEVLVAGFRHEHKDLRHKLAQVGARELDERRRAAMAEDECLRLHRRLERIPSRIRSFFDRIHRIRRAWEYVTNVTNQA